MQFIQNANDETYTGFGGIRVFDKIPCKMVIKTKTKNIAIGAGLASFNIEALKEEFKKRKKSITIDS